jgi:hypothetical protein
VRLILSQAQRPTSPEELRNEFIDGEEMTPEELAYLAGFIDGEGSLQIQRRIHRNEFGEWLGYSIYLDVGQTRRDILEYLKEQAGGGCIHHKPSVGNRKQSWMLRIMGSQALKFVSQIRPYLRVKSEIADVFLRFPMTGRKTTDEQRQIKDALFLRARELNHRGLCEGATTISQESRTKRSEAPGPAQAGDDIVSSA